MTSNNAVDPVSKVARNAFKTSDNDHFKGMTTKKKKKATYDQRKIFLGWSYGGKALFDRLEEQHIAQGHNPQAAKRLAGREMAKQATERRRKIFLDRGSPGDADVLFIGGRRGSGKSFIMRGLSNRSSLAGVTNILLDPEHEYYTNNQYNGIQSHLENLRKNEEPQTIKTAVLMPRPVYKARRQRDMPHRGYETDEFHVFNFSLEDLTANDISFMMKKIGADHQDWQMYRNRLGQEVSKGNITSWTDAKDLAYEMSEEGNFKWDQNGQTPRADEISSSIEMNFEQWDFLSSNRTEDDPDELDLETVLNENQCVALSLQDGDGLPDELAIKEIFVAVLFKKVRNLVEQGKVEKPVSWRLDEAHELAPAGADSNEHPSKGQIRQGIKKDRKRGFRIDMATQEPGDVQQKNFLDQSSHILIPANMKRGPRNTLLEAGGVLEAGGHSSLKWDRVFEAITSNIYKGWLYVNEEEKDWHIVEVASPIAYHRSS